MNHDADHRRGDKPAGHHTTSDGPERQERDAADGHAAMSRARAAWVRGGLIFFTAVSAALGAYIFISPVGFFGWSWINMGMAYNPHLLLDYGAMNLAAAIFLGGAAISMNPAFVRTALASYAVWSVAHFFIHLYYRQHFIAYTSLSEANVLMGLLSVGAVVPIVLLLMTFGSRAESPARRGGDAP